MSDARLLVRSMSANDAAAVADLCTQLGYRATSEEIARRFVRIEAQGRSAVFVAEETGRVVGWIHVLATPLLESDLYGQIAGLVVDDACRSRGIGLALLQQGEQWARAAGCASMRVHSRVVRERAHAFYERHGFVRVKTQHAFEKSLIAHPLSLISHP